MNQNKIDFNQMVKANKTRYAAYQADKVKISFPDVDGYTKIKTVSRETAQELSRWLNITIL